MRMWAIPTKLLCMKHLVAEHREMHCAYGAVTSTKKPKKFNIAGYINGLIDFSILKTRHDELVAELDSRSKTKNKFHKTPEIENLPNIISSPIDVQHNWQELYYRCTECRKRMLAGVTANR